MNLAWLVARAAGIVSWALLALSLTWGFLLATRVLGRKPRARWLLDLHRFLGGLAVVFVGVHLVAIFADTYVSFSLTQLLVPLTSEYRPLAVAWGIVAFYVLVAVEVTSLLMKHLPRRVWHVVHLASYPLFVLATVHLLTAGTDSTNVVLRWLAILTLVEATVFVVVRLIDRQSATTTSAAGATGPADPIGVATMPPGDPGWWAQTTMPSAPPVADAHRPPTSAPRS